MVDKVKKSNNPNNLLLSELTKNDYSSTNIKGFFGEQIIDMNIKIRKVLNQGICNGVSTIVTCIQQISYNYTNAALGVLCVFARLQACLMQTFYCPHN
jgi:hypothetical protein